VEAALEPLRHQGKRILHLDDLLSCSEETARTDTMTVIEHISLLGFAINWEKSSPFPCHQLDSVTMSVKLSPPRRDAVPSALSPALVGRRVTALSIMYLLGLIAAAHLVVFLWVCFSCADCRGG